MRIETLEGTEMEVDTRRAARAHNSNVTDNASGKIDGLPGTTSIAAVISNPLPGAIFFAGLTHFDKVGVGPTADTRIRTNKVLVPG